MSHQDKHRHCVVLVVDDTLDTRQMLKLALETNGYEVEVATNGAEALHALTQQRFDAVLTDMWMPEMTGAQFIHAARADPGSAGLYIVMMSGAFGQGFPADVDANAFLRKPFEVQPLLDLLEQVPCVPAT
jgi:CheY-like chemotaxis protein